jgi:hypothetical protein
MSVAELLPTIQSLPRAEQEQLYRFLSEELSRGVRDVEPLPESFPPASDGCPATRDELVASRREVGVYRLDEIWRSLGAQVPY